MRGFRVEHPDPPELKRRLYDEHRIEVPVFETADGWVLRVSVQGYNDETDLDGLASRCPRNREGLTAEKPTESRRSRRHRVDMPKQADAHGLLRRLAVLVTVLVVAIVPTVSSTGGATTPGRNVC